MARWFGVTAGLILALLALPRCAAGSSYDAFYGSGGRPPPPGKPGQPAAAGAQPQPYGAGAGIDSFSEKGPPISPYDQVQQHIANTKAMVQGAARHARWFNVANGMLLIVTGPFNIILSALTLKLVDVMTSAYLSLFGVLLVAMEIPLSSLQRPMREYFRFLYTRFGRAFFLVLVSNLAMVCGKVGFITAALTVSNAVLNVYLLGHNRDQSGREANMVSSTMEQMRTEVSGQLGGLKLFGGLTGLGGNLLGMVPFLGGRRRRDLAADIGEGGDGFDNPFAAAGAGAPGDGGFGTPAQPQAGGYGAQGGVQGARGPGAQAQGGGDAFSRRDTSDGPGGRSPFDQQGGAYSAFAPRQPGAGGYGPLPGGQQPYQGQQAARPGQRPQPQGQQQQQYPQQVRARRPCARIERSCVSLSLLTLPHAHAHPFPPSSSGKTLVRLSLGRDEEAVARAAPHGDALAGEFKASVIVL